MPYSSRSTTTAGAGVSSSRTLGGFFRMLNKKVSYNHILSGMKMPVSNRLSAMPIVLGPRPFTTLIGIAITIIILSLAIFAVSIPFIPRIAAFLSHSSPIDKPNIVVVEAWTSPETFRKAAQVFKENRAPALVICGVSKEKNVHVHRNNVVYLIKNRVPLTSIVLLTDTIPSSHRTLTSARLLGFWIENSGIDTPRVQLVTLGAHSRKTHAIYKKVLGDSIATGIISVPEQFGKRAGIIRRFRYWRYVMRHVIGWVYAMVLPV